MRSSLLAITLLATACGSGVHDLSLPIDRLGTVKGRVDPAALAAKQSGLPLRAAIAWGAVPEYDHLCGEWREKNETLKKDCADPFRFIVGELQSNTALTLAADDSFELPIMALPSANVAVGDSKSRISYGALVVIEDREREDLPSFLDRRIEGKVLAASFVSLTKPQQRLVFREGTFDAGSFFYPAPGCDTPPVGFSVLMPSAYAAQPPFGACESATLESRIELSVLDEAEATPFQCQGNQTLTLEPPDESLEGFDLQNFQCLDHEHGFVATPDLCHTFLYMPLKGCYGDATCEKPDWDLRDHPPGWWPC